MIIDILAVHVLFREVAALVLEDLAVHRQYLREEADLCLFLQLVAGVAVDEDPFTCSVGVQVQKTEEFTPFVEMQNNLFDCVDRGVNFGTGIDVASIEVYSVGVDSVCPTGYSIWVEDWEQVEHKLVA